MGKGIFHILPNFVDEQYTVTIFYEYFLTKCYNFRLRCFTRERFSVIFSHWFQEKSFSSTSVKTLLSNFQLHEGEEKKDAEKDDVTYADLDKTALTSGTLNIITSSYELKYSGVWIF